MMVKISTGIPQLDAAQQLKLLSAIPFGCFYFITLSIRPATPSCLNYLNIVRPPLHPYQLAESRLKNVSQ